MTWRLWIFGEIKISRCEKEMNTKWYQQSSNIFIISFDIENDRNFSRIDLIFFGPAKVSIVFNKKWIIIKRFRCTIASILEQKTFQRLLFFFWGNLVFRLGTPFSASVSKIFASAFFWDIGGNNGFSLKNSGGQPQFLTEFLL